METTTTKSTAAKFNAANLKRKKITAEIVKLSEMDAGDSITGIYKGQSKRPWTDKSTGEVKEITQVLFENPENQERYNVFADAGFLNALSAAGVKENTLIEVVKLEMVDLGGGRRVNQYDIFELTPN